MSLADDNGDRCAVTLDCRMFLNDLLGRRGVPIVVLAAWVVAPGWCSATTAAAPAFGFDDVDRRAKAAAEASFAPAKALPRELQNLQYDQYRDIRYKPDRSLWRDAKLPFEIAFFHQGWHFEQAVRVNEVTASGVHEVKFDPDQFDYGANKVDKQPLKGLGYAGFRVQGRGARLSRRKLLPGAGQGPALRAFGEGSRG
jgi:glucans biosynthesis protein